MVQNIHLGGGSILGVSRGAPNISDVVDSLQVPTASFTLFFDFLSIRMHNYMQQTRLQLRSFIQFKMSNSMANLSQEQGINMVFVLGGNGTHAGANEVHKEVQN